jgi:hypothetical protein
MSKLRYSRIGTSNVDPNLSDDLAVFVPWLQDVSIEDELAVAEVRLIVLAVNEHTYVCEYDTDAESWSVERGYLA